jgi:hypothetical protein
MVAKLRKINERSIAGYVMRIKSSVDGLLYHLIVLTAMRVPPEDSFWTAAENRMAMIFEPTSTVHCEVTAMSLRSLPFHIKRTPVHARRVSYATSTGSYPSSGYSAASAIYFIGAQR